MHHITGKEEAYEDTAEHCRGTDADDDGICTAVAFLYLLHTENGQFGGVGLNLAELLSQAPHIRSQLARKIHVSLRDGNVFVHAFDNVRHCGFILGRPEPIRLFEHCGAQIFQAVRNGSQFFLGGAQRKASDLCPQSVEFDAQSFHVLLVADVDPISPVSEYAFVYYCLHGIEGFHQIHKGLIILKQADAFFLVAD